MDLGCSRWGNGVTVRLHQLVSCRGLPEDASAGARCWEGTGTVFVVVVNDVRCEVFVGASLVERFGHGFSWVDYMREANWQLGVVCTIVVIPITPTVSNLLSGLNQETTLAKPIIDL